MLTKHVVVSSTKQVIKHPKIVWKGRFVRDSDKIYGRIARLIAEVRSERAHRVTSPQQIGAWIVQLKKLARQLDDGSTHSLVRLYELVRWYRDHFDDDEFIPRVDSVSSLIVKFDRLEDAWRRRVKLKNANGYDLTNEQVLRQNGVTNHRLVDTIVRDLVIPARRLRLIDIPNDVGLTTCIVKLHNTIRDERNGANLSSSLKVKIGGPLEILRKYIQWLSEKDWEASSRVLLIDSPAFAQFRREFRNLEGNDPINGRERQYN